MSDVYCSNCGEPWEAYHLRHDLVYETSLVSEQEMKEISNRGLKLTDTRAIKDLEEQGWKFAGSVLVIAHCPACLWHERQGHLTGPAREEAAGKEGYLEGKAELAVLLGDDEDGLQAMLEDLEF